MMATDHHDALWAKLHELELQLAAYKLLRGDADAAGAASEAPAGGSGTCRGRQYDAYMRRRDARRVAAASAEHHHHQQQQPRGARATPRLAIAPPKRTPAAVAVAVSSIPSTPRKDGAAPPVLPRSRTVSAGGGGGATGSPARSHHQRRNSLGVVAEFGECVVTPRPFLKRGTGTGGAAVPATTRLMRTTTTRVHDLPAAIDVAVTTPRPLRQQELGHAHTHAPPRHVRSVSELPFETAAAEALASPQGQGRVRKRWGSPERPTAAMFSAASASAAGESHRDLSKGLKKLLSFVTRKGGRSVGGGEQAFPAAAVASPRGSSGKPVSKGSWSGCSHVDVPSFDRAASLDEHHRFPMTRRAVGISG